MRNRQFPGRRSPVVALASLIGGALIVLTAAVPALSAAAGATPTGPPIPPPAVSASAAISLPAGPSLGIGTAISTSRRPPASAAASALATLGVDAASDSASQVQAVTTAPALLPTGVNAGHGTSIGVPAISEFGGSAALVLLLGGLFGYRRRTGAHRV